MGVKGLNKSLFKPMINFLSLRLSCLVLDGVSLFCLSILFSLCNLVFLGVGYLQPLLAFQPIPPYGFSLLLWK